MIHMKDITFHYAKNPLFSKLDLEIPRGNIYGLLGMNGAGKTTLLKLISGQLFRTEGKAEVMGFDPQQRNPEMLADMFYLPEEFYLQKISMEEFLKIYTPFYPKFNKTELDSYLNIFGIDTSKKLSDLSFGQKKKFLLSFGLASNTSLLILDEPTNGLDIPSKSQFRRIVASALTDDRTFIISTHWQMLLIIFPFCSPPRNPLRKQYSIKKKFQAAGPIFRQEKKKLRSHQLIWRHSLMQSSPHQTHFLGKTLQ